MFEQRSLRHVPSLWTWRPVFLCFFLCERQISFALAILSVVTEMPLMRGAMGLSKFESLIDKYFWFLLKMVKNILFWLGFGPVLAHSSQNQVIWKKARRINSSSKNKTWFWEQSPPTVATKRHLGGVQAQTSRQHYPSSALVRCHASLHLTFLLT